MKTRATVAALIAAVGLVLSGCGGPKYTADQKQQAEDFCSSSGAYLIGGMGLDKYTNTAGFDRCVEDAVKVTDCLDTPSSHLDPWVPKNCDNDGYN